MEKAIHNTAYRSLVLDLQRARQAKGLSQKDVARTLGFARTWLSKVETLEIRLDVLQLVRLANIYSLDVHQLIDVLQRDDTESPVT